MIHMMNLTLLCFVMVLSKEESKVIIEMDVLHLLHGRHVWSMIFNFGDPKQASMQERTININGKEYLEREIRRLFQKFLGEISKNFKPEGIGKKKYDVFKEMDKHQWQAEITVFTKYKDKKIDLEEMIKNIENLVNTQENDLENGQGNGWEIVWASSI